MPWNISNYPISFKNLSVSQRRKAIDIANAVLRDCLADGGTDEKCAPKAIRIALAKVQGGNMAEELNEAYIDSAWNNDKSDYTIEQLARAVPAAILKWAQARAKKEDRDIIKDDLKLRYKEPNGDININGIRAALRRLPRTTGIPQSVLSAARKELENVLSRAKKELGIQEEIDVLGEPFEEEIIWNIPLSEDAIIVEGNAGDKLVKAEVKLIRAGWSKNKRYYPASLLKKRAPLFERVGSFNGHVNKPKVTDYTGWFEDVHWSDADNAIVGTFNIFDPDVKRIAEHAPHLIALSIAAQGSLVRGEAEGKKGWLVEDIVAARSCDVVVSAAAGGKIKSIMEAIEDKEAELEVNTIQDLRKAYPDLLEEFKKDILAQTEEQDKDKELARLQEELEAVKKEKKALEHKVAVFESRDVLESVLDKAELPEASKNRIRDLFKDEVVEEENVVRAIEAEKEYVKALTEEVPVQGVKPESDPLEESNDEVATRLRKLFGLVEEGDE